MNYHETHYHVFRSRGKAPQRLILWVIGNHGPNGGYACTSSVKSTRRGECSRGHALIIVIQATILRPRPAPYFLYSRAFCESMTLSGSRAFSPWSTPHIVSADNAMSESRLRISDGHRRSRLPGRFAGKLSRSFSRRMRVPAAAADIGISPWRRDNVQTVGEVHIGRALPPQRDRRHLLRQQLYGLSATVRSHAGFRRQPGSQFTGLDGHRPAGAIPRERRSIL